MNDANNPAPIVTVPRISGTVQPTTAPVLESSSATDIVCELDAGAHVTTTSCPEAIELGRISVGGLSAGEIKGIDGLT